MRKIDKIIIHCSATKAKMNIGAKEITAWHKRRGFNTIGYHLVVNRSGKQELGRKISKIGAHCKGQNKNSLGICLVGGIDENGIAQNNFTKEQFDCLELVLRNYLIQFPRAKIYAHNQFSSKACPSFELQEWLVERGLREYWGQV